MDFKVHESCCGSSLRTGSLIIGAIDAVTSLLGIVGHIELSIPSLYSGDHRSLYPWFLGLVIFIMISHAWKLVTCSLLLFGVFKNRSKLVLIWVITHVIVIVIHFFKSISLIFLVVTVTKSTGVIIFIVIAHVMELALALYYFVVVRSYYDEMQ